MTCFFLLNTKIYFKGCFNYFYRHNKNLNGPGLTFFAWTKSTNTFFEIHTEKKRKNFKISLYLETLYIGCYIACFKVLEHHSKMLECVWVCFGVFSMF